MTPNTVEARRAAAGSEGRPHRWWRVAAAAVFAVVAATGVVVIVSQPDQLGPAAADGQVWVALQSTGPAATAQVAVDGRTVGGSDLAGGDSDHRTYLVPDGATIRVTVTALDDGGDVTELTRTMCAIGDSVTDELLVTENGYGKGEIVCTWRRPAA